ncbi:beta-L-arabinofuranosidase domain-containing protein [Flavitalea flava]
MKKRPVGLLSIALSLLVTGTLSAQSYVPEFANREMKVAPVVNIEAYPFDIKEVRLLDGPFKEAMEADARYLLVIEPDRLLSDFRAHAGLKAKGERYGGWESSGLAGHSLGHYLSACALQYASTDDRRYLDRVNYMVDELALCQAARVKGRGEGYIGAIPREDSLWMEIAAGHIRSRGFDLNGAWSPWYTVHKIMAGLLDAYLYCNNAKALQVEKKMADWTGTIVNPLSDSLLQKMLFCEYGGMNDVLVNTYSLTGNKKYLDLSYKFHDKRILDSLSLGLDVLAGKHSNTQIPKVIGCARRYELTGSEKDRQISEYFWATIVNNYSYATGGNSNYEYLGQPHKLNDQLTDNTTETCNTYNMLKLTRHLFAWHPKASLMDYYERGLYNHILASQNHDDGMMCYFVALRMGTRKEYSDSFNTFTCCVGSGMENHVKYGESIYFRGKDGSLFVNLFIPSRLNWKEKGITVEQQTHLPADDKVSLLIGVQKPSVFSIRIRKPYWAGKGILLNVNGKELEHYGTGADGYIILDRLWKNGDKIELTLPESIHTVAMPDNPGRIALFYGPVILAGVLGNTEPDPVKGIPVLVTNEKDPNKWIKREGDEKLAFRAVMATGQQHEEMKVKMIPFNRTKNEYYSVYWDYFTPETWAVQQVKYQEEKKKRQELEDLTIDKLRLGEMQPERDHSFTGEKLNTGEEHGQKWRSAEEGGNFSFTMKVNSTVDHTLICSYWGSDHRGRIFDIQIDGHTIATQDLNGLKESKFYEINYPVAKELLQGKDKVVVTFKAKTARNSVGPVFGTIRMVRAGDPQVITQ